ncbi:MAG: sulfotransferase [Chloroflexi bacterium]|nr:sulfotransferase [Chloroflexota bacterium]
MNAVVDRPLFLIGMPRSGTTLIFEIFAAHHELAWLSQYMDLLPRLPALAVVSRLADVDARLRRSVNRSDRDRSLLQRLLPGPSEAYRVWERCCGEKFRYEYLLGTTPTPEEAACMRRLVASVVRFQAKRRFAAKLTGPGRIQYLSSIFPEARFAHVVRDGRAVVRSLLAVPFWQSRERMSRPAWSGGLSERDMQDVGRYGSPKALAAVQWRRVVESTRAEGAHVGDRYAEFKYERFTAAPLQTLHALFEFAQLEESAPAAEFLSRRGDIKDMNYRSFRELGAGDREMYSDLIGQALAAFEYAE